MCEVEIFSSYPFTVDCNQKHMKPQERVPPHPPQIWPHFFTKQNSQTELEQGADEEGQRGGRRASIQRL